MNLRQVFETDAKLSENCNAQLFYRHSSDRLKTNFFERRIIDFSQIIEQSNKVIY